MKTFILEMYELLPPIAFYPESEKEEFHHCVKQVNQRDSPLKRISDINRGQNRSTSDGKDQDLHAEPPANRSGKENSPGDDQQGAHRNKPANQQEKPRLSISNPTYPL